MSGIDFESSFNLGILTLMNTVNSSMYNLGAIDFFNMSLFTKLVLMIFMIIGRFSSLDIFLISILLFIGKSVSFIDGSLSVGFYFLCAGTIMGLLQVEKYLKP